MQLHIKFLSVLFCFFCLSSINADEVSKILQKIPLEDKEKIEKLFSFFVRRDSLGYVLFGNTKSTCATGISLSCKEVVIPPSWSDKPIRFQKDLKEYWEVWSRWEHLFKHPNILVCTEHVPLGGGMYLQLYFINKRTLESLLQKHHTDFAEILGEKFSPKTFIVQLEKKKKLRPLIKHDEKLLGILLGFGKESSEAFKSFSQGIDTIPTLGRIAQRPKGCLITPVCFRGYEDSWEVKELTKIYAEEIQEIDQIYKSSSFLVHTLEKYCGS
jgi:hypothetical protein